MRITREHYLKYLDRHWKSRLDSLSLFVEKHNRLPSSTKKKESPAYNFMITQRNLSLYGLLSITRYDLFKEFLTNYGHHMPTKKLRKEWKSRLDSLSLFVEKHNRLPSSTKKDERSDYTFIIMQRSFFLRDILPATRRKLFKEFLNNYGHHFSQKLCRKDFQSRLKSIEAFIKKHNKLPLCSKKGEKTDCNFLHIQKTKLNANLLTKTKAYLLKEFIRKYGHLSPTKEWQSRLDSIEAFIEKHNRLPNFFDKNERSDSDFLRMQRYKLKKNTLSEERIITFKAFLHKFQQHFK